VLGASSNATTTVAPSAAGENLPALEQELVALEFRSHACSFQFDKNLRRGMSNADVKNLQIVLNYLPTANNGATIATTGYFGTVTEAAVIAFQNMWSNKILIPNGMSAGNGFVGAATRAVLNTLCAQSNSTVN
jgi:peptidoglycan hydrolase-like protein with peptidoglycan-binding domain